MIEIKKAFCIWKYRSRNSTEVFCSWQLLSLSFHRSNGRCIRMDDASDKENVSICLISSILPWVLVNLLIFLFTSFIHNFNCRSCVHWPKVTVCISWKQRIEKEVVKNAVSYEGKETRMKKTQFMDYQKGPIAMLCYYQISRDPVEEIRCHVVIWLIVASDLSLS